MRIGIDARAAYNVTDGIGRYCVNLLRALAQLPDNNEYVILRNPDFSGSFGLDKRFRELVVGVKRFSPVEQVVLPQLLHHLELEGFHSLHFTLPVLYQGHQIMTVYDIMPLRFPWFFGENTRWKYPASLYFNFLVRLGVRRASLIIVVSDYTSRDVQEHLGVSGECITRIYPGVDHTSPVLATEIRRVREKYQLPRDYVLTVTNFRPYKNIPRLLRAFSIIIKQQMPVDLVIAGEHKRYEEPVRALAQEVGGKQIRLLGFVPNGDLAALTQGASAFAFPSLYEGFGFPILEAMALGVPVITSGLASLPEIGGGAVLYVDPTSVSSIADALLQVLENQNLATSLVARGRERAKRFSWRCTAKAVSRLYQDVFSVED